MSAAEALINLIHREVLRVLHRQQTRRTPVIVDGYDKGTHAVKVRLMPDSIDEPVVTGWLSLHPLQTGNGFGWHMPPNIGDPGWVEFHDDDREAGQFVGAAFNDQFPPVEVEAGEFLYKHKSGASIYFKQDGSVTVTDKAGSTVIMDGQNNVHVKAANGNLTVDPGSGTLFLGGDGAGGSYDFVVTLSGPSTNVKAKFG